MTNIEILVFIASCIGFLTGLISLIATVKIMHEGRNSTLQNDQIVSISEDVKLSAFNGSNTLLVGSGEDKS
ncbi:hypothetical protein ATE84_2910 [Aquimarina sp. MAR_2010_214]|uniref:hypothetical protein n=1 Tax=Aquimarina sp. MAR_2010_214 TaxID=1250026 RepID=UPI000CB37A34|nr:hypothetical protein [Aquimarina sp. MAR_2010_214]PKV50843.1 hypothetical protein ATE84_2910 [Aquimarina sp. MAR_2010_214]